MQKNNNTFNGSTTVGNNTTGDVTYPQYINDPITYCPYCGKHLIINTDEIKYCPYCGKAIPRTHTGGSYIIHWNYPDGTPSWPRDGIIHPYTTC